MNREITITGDDFVKLGEVACATIYHLSKDIEDDHVWQELAETVHCPKCFSVQGLIVAWDVATKWGLTDICCCSDCFHSFGMVDPPDEGGQP